MDMYEYMLQFPQPPLVIPSPKPQPPQPPKSEEFLTRSQAREKARKEKQELRDWWADLPEEKRQEVRETKYWLNDKPKQKKPEKKKEKEKPKPAKPAADAAKEEEKYIRQSSPSDDRPPGKPDWNSYCGPQQWAMVEM
jgi:hypothetical protein